MKRAVAIVLLIGAAARADEPAVRGIARQEGKPVAGITVRLLTYEGETISTAVADRDGRFTLPRSAGRLPYAAFARCDRHVGWQRYFPSSDDEFTEPETSLALSATSMATGRLLDAAGKPLPGRALKLSSLDSGKSGDYFAPPRELVAESSPITAADGTFAIPGVPAGGRAIVDLAAAGYVGAHLRVATGERRDYRLDAPGHVRLKFDLPAGAAAPAGTIRLFYGGEKSEPEQAVFGYGQVSVPPGDNPVIGSLYPQAYSLRFELARECKLVAASPVTVTVRSGSTADATVKFTLAARLRGRVVDAATGGGIAGAFVFAQNVRKSQGPWSGSGQTDADGRFDVLCEPGTLRISVQQQPADYVWAEVPAQTVEAAAGADLTLADFKARPRVSATAVVVDGNGKPVAGATVRSAHDAFSSRGRVPRTDAAGRVTLRRLDPDDFTVLRARTATAVTVQPVRLDPRETPQPVKLTVSEAAAFRATARIADADGRPIAGATVRVEWRYPGVGKQASYGGVGFLGTYHTDADGRMTTQVMWPGDEYRLQVAADGFAATETALVRGEAGATHDFGTVKLVRVGQIVRGRVVDAEGTPVAGVRVFNEGDAPQRLEAISASDGSFTLKGFAEGPCWVFARHPAYRFAATRAASGDTGATVRLVASDAPAASDQPAARPAEFAAAERALALHLATQMWALPHATLRGFSRTVFDGVLRLDPEFARKWYDERRKANDPATSERGHLTQVVRWRDAAKVADDDLDEALGLVSQVPADESFAFILKLAKKYSASDPAKATRCLQEAAVRSRALQRYPVTSLASVADAAIDAGRVPEGRKLLAECVARIENTPTGSDRILAIGRLAVILAGTDLDACRKMLARTESASEYNRWLGNAAIELAGDDPDRAVKLLAELKPASGSWPALALAQIAVRAASADAAKAAAIAETVPLPVYRVAALAGVAARAGRDNPELAQRLIDRCLDRLMDNPHDYSSWTGGRLGLAAAVAVQARAAGYPDLASVTARVLACRPPHGAGGDEHQSSEVAHAATILVLTDPAAAKLLLDQAPPKADTRDGLFAVALIDPAGRGRAAVDAALARAREKSDGVSGTSLVELFGTLSAVPGRDRVSQLRTWLQVGWLIDGRGEK